MQPRKESPDRTVKTKKGIETVREDALKLARRIQALPPGRLHITVSFRVADTQFACIVTGAGVKIERF